MREFLFFSHNNNKQKEIKDIFTNHSLKILTPSEFSITFEPNETGKSFEENAKIKSDFGFKKTSFWCFSDDSGICIEALNNKPGIFSKNFIRSFKSENDCFKYIFKKIKKNK